MMCPVVGRFGEIEEWMDGRRVTGKQGARPVPKSSRPVEFRKKNIFVPISWQHNCAKIPLRHWSLVRIRRIIFMA